MKIKIEVKKENKTTKLEKNITNEELDHILEIQKEIEETKWNIDNLIELFLDAITPQKARDMIGFFEQQLKDPIELIMPDFKNN